MPEAEPQLLCPTCHRLVAVEPGWRLAQCPYCQTMITRMGEDSAYD